MSLIEILTDTDNSFLSRREIVCDFRGLGGKLKKTDAIDTVSYTHLTLPTTPYV